MNPNTILIVVSACAIGLAVVLTIAIGVGWIIQRIAVDPGPEVMAREFSNEGRGRR